jgi:hypothetical protein
VRYPKLAALVASAVGLGACASTSPAEKTIEPPVAPDTAFVLSRDPAPARKTESPDMAQVHVGDLWWPFRGSYLKVGEARARDRDGDIWSVFCNECHGGRRKMEDVVAMPGPAANWGRGDGLFFGIRRPYAEIFRTISNGKIEKEGNRWKMPAWRGKLAKEQIWALIYFIEYQSGGIEGRFPPSLYPRGETAERP